MKKNISAPVTKNEIIDITITDFSVEGSGIGHYQGFAVFVPLSVPQDKLQVKIIKVTKNYAFGKIEKITTPSPYRVEPDCPVFAKCGGCGFRHIKYEQELQFKEKRVSDALQRIAGIEEAHINPIAGSDSRNRYRNKCLLPIGQDTKVEIGFYAPHSHRIIDCSDCLLQPKEFSQLTEKLREFIEKYKISIYDESTHTGLLRKFFLRKGEVTGEIMVCIVINGSSFPREKEFAEFFTGCDPNIKSIIVNSNTQKTNVALGKKNRVIYGKESIDDILCGLQFSISPLSFYQVNHNQAQRLYEKAGEYAQLTNEDTLLDLYCGTGTIGLSLAKKVRQLIGVEIIPEAVENAKNNALINNIENAVFYCSDTGNTDDCIISSLKQKQIDVIIVDPPRKGCSPETLDLIADISPKRLVYISCNPATLARDIKILMANGFFLSEVSPFDLFPATTHVECVCLMTKI